MIKSKHRLITLLVLAAILIIADVVLTFFFAPLVKGAGLSEPVVIAGQLVENRLLFSQKIFYLHVPVAIVSFAALGVAAMFSLRYLLDRDHAWDMKAATAAEVSLVFVLATMASGIFWTRFEWGVWWVWEPRLTTYFILTLLVLAYFVLRTNIDDETKKARYAAVFSILAFIDVPISFFITRLVPSSIHPVIFTSNSGLSTSMLIPFLLGLIGMMLLGIVIYQVRFALHSSKLRLESIKLRYEALSKKEKLARIKELD
ncbi:MAG: cytochrome c biogenesis protein [Coriobacteriia bacterium]|nr:cytochrome c biogenesis protein [Coriobacteriia bacterium]